MKKLFTLFLIVIATVALQSNEMLAQCPGCVIDQSCGVGISPVEPTLCPAALPNGVQGQPYDENATFFMPRDFTDSGSGQDVTLNSVTVTSVTGMPQGLSYECDQPGCAYAITNDPATQRGCVKMCGVPTVPGTYNIVIQVVANVSTPIGVINQPTGFTLPLVVEPAAGGNCCFSFDPPTGCGELDVEYDALLNFEPLQPTSYSWDFGNGNTSTDAEPAIQNYNTPGDYYPELVTTVNNYVLSDVSVTASASGWCGDIEEVSLFGVCQGAPDLFFDYANNGEVYTSSEGSNSLTTSWSNLGIELNSLTFSMTFWDSDGTSQNDNLGALAFSVTGEGTFNFQNSEVFGTYTIGTAVDTIITTVDTITVNPVPASPTLAFSPAQQVCAGDSILVDGPAGPYQYQWLNSGTFVSDSTAIWVNAAAQGWYSLLVIDTTFFCGAESDSALIEILGTPQPPILSYNSATGNLEIDNPNEYDVEWYNDGVLVQGETGDTLPSLGETGPFSASFINGGLCASSQSNEYWVCSPAAATPLLSDTICCGQTVTFEAPGFETNPFVTVAWAITPEFAGPVTNQASATVAGDNGDIVIEYGESIDFTRGCSNLVDSVATGTYYVTPFAIEDPNVSPLTYDTLQGCRPFAEICPTLEADDDGWEIFPMVFTFPDNSQLNVNDAIAFGLPIDQALLDFATGGELPCLNLTDLFAGNPNGEWSITVTNTGTTAMDVGVPDFVVINFADSCNLITEDESYLIEGIDLTINPGETVTASFDIPPLPGGFPSVADNCAAFGEPIMVTFADCYPELTNTMQVTGVPVNPTIDAGNNYVFGYIDVSVLGGNPPYTYSWDDGPTTEDRFNLLPGTYTITVTDATGFSLSETFTLTGPYLGLDELEEYGFSLGTSVPNPTSGNAVITFTSKERNTYEFIVRDAAGRVVSTMPVNSAKGENRIIFDGSNLSAGMYTYSLSNGVNVLTERLMISK